MESGRKKNEDRRKRDIEKIRNYKKAWKAKRQKEEFEKKIRLKKLNESNRKKNESKKKIKNKNEQTEEQKANEEEEEKDDEDVKQKEIDVERNFNILFKQLKNQNQKPVKFITRICGLKIVPKIVEPKIGLSREPSSSPSPSSKNLAVQQSSRKNRVQKESSSNLSSSSYLSDLSYNKHKTPKIEKETDLINNKKKIRMMEDDYFGALGPDAARINEEVNNVIEKIEKKNKDKIIQSLKKKNAKLRKLLKEKNQIILSLKNRGNYIQKSIIKIATNN